MGAYKSNSPKRGDLILLKHSSSPGLLIKRVIGIPGAGSMVEIEKYLTQEELAQMVAARRERVSTALNFLRRQGAVHYLPHGHLSLNVRVLESHSS
jgi:hypothetical protein